MTTSTTATTTTVALFASSPPPCEDKTGFQDQRGLGCEDWQGQNCSALPEGYNQSGLQAVQVNCPVSCGACDGLEKPQVVIQHLKQVAFELQVTVDLSALSPAARAQVAKACFADALSVHASSLTASVGEVTGQPLPAGRPSYNLRCAVVLPASTHARIIMMQATALADPTSAAFRAFVRALAAAGVDTSTLSVAVSTLPSTSMVTVAVGSDGTISAPAGPALGGASVVVSASCADSQRFVDEQGEGCSGWVGYDCDSVVWLKTEKPYTVKGLLAVQAQCPLSCGFCSPPGRPSPADLAANCMDDVYVAAWCLRWRGLNCSDAVRLGYSPEYQRLLVDRCPLSCGRCGNGTPALLDFPGFQDERGHNCSSWRGSDCTRTYAGYTRKGMLMVQSACQDSCFGNQSSRLATSCEDDVEFSSIHRYKCEDFVGRICTYATLYLNARWLLGPRGALAWHEDVWGHCPVACGLCDPQERPTISDLFTDCQDDPYVENWCGYKWKGHNCSRWDQFVNLVVPHEGERFNATLLGRCPSTCQLCKPPVCQAGTYRDVRHHVCSPCPVGSFMPTSTSGPDALACRLCRRGFHMPHPGGVAEEPCILGEYAALAGQARCDACPPGRYAGKRAMEACIECQAGWFQGAHGASACERCPRGTYSTSTRSTACAACPPLLTTLREASPSDAACGCPPGQWRPLGSGACEDCPPGMFCPGGHSQFDTGPDLTAQLPPGMMSLREDPSSVYTCVAEDVCPGYRPLPYTPELFEEVCPGDRGGPRCSKCPAGSFLTDSGDCQDCRSRGVFGSGLNVVIAFALGVWGAEQCYRSCARYRNEGTYLFWAVVAFAQGLVPVLKMPIKWPKPVLMLFKIIIPFSIPGLWELWDFNSPFKCIVGEGFILETVKNITIPLLAFVNTGMLYIVYPLMRRRVDRALAMCCVACTWDGAWIALCIMAVMLFPTDTMPNGKEFLRYSPSVEMGSKDWLASLPLGLGAIAFYICAYLAYTLYGVCKAPRLMVENPDFGNQFGYIVYMYTPEAYWWGLVLYTSNFTYALIQVFATPVSQIYAMMFLYIFMVLLEARVYPSIYLQMNRVNIAMKGTHLFFVILSVTFADTEDPEAKALGARIPKVIMAIGLTVTAILLLLTAHAVFFGVGEEKWRAVQNQRVARRSRAVMTLVAVMPDKKFVQTLQNMFDSDRDDMREHCLMLTAVFLQMQSGRSWWRQRIIPNATTEVYDQRVVSARAYELVRRKEICRALDANAELYKLLDRLQDTVAEVGSGHGLDAEQQPVSAAVVASLAQKALRRTSEGGSSDFKKVRASATFMQQEDAGQGHGCFPGFSSNGPTPSDRHKMHFQDISLKAMEEVTIPWTQFYREFGERGLAEQDLMHLYQAFDRERTDMVPLARIVAIILSHVHSHLGEDLARGPPQGATLTAEFDSEGAGGLAAHRSLVPRMIANDIFQESVMSAFI